MYAPYGEVFHWQIISKESTHQARDLMTIDINIGSNTRIFNYASKGIAYIWLNMSFSSIVIYLE